MKIVRGKKFYRPREMANLGLITNSKGDSGSETSHYVYILKLISTGQLKAKDYAKVGDRPFWLVSEDEVERYNDQFFNE